MKSENVNFYIPTLKNGDKTATAHQDKANILLQYYTNLFNSNPPRMNTLNWESLNIQRYDLEQLDTPITEEVKKVIFEAQPEKAPGPDGFKGLFYKTC